MVEVHERTDPSTFAITEYTYGPDDLVASVNDPDNVTVTMTHDFAGRRTQVTRPGNRSWKYTYDKNGNVIAEQVPGSTSPPVTDPAYTTTIAYDDLDRPASKVIGQRDLSAPDQALFGSRTETFAWDLGGNHKGFLRYWQSFAPSTSTASVTLDVGNNNQGQRTVTNHTLNIAGYPQLSRQFINSYWLFGGVRQTRYSDLVGGGNQTTVTTSYDARLMPSNLLLQRTGEPNQIIANQTRNVAGLVTKRRTDTTGAMTFVESNWTYDKLGRVIDQTVQKGPGPTQVARQSMTYLGNDDPATLDHYVGATQRHFVYGYDLRHQLTSAAETTTPGYFSSSYAYGGATSSGRIKRAVEAQTLTVGGSEVKPRDVTYFYSTVDPEQVTHLRITNSNTAYATFTYDASGNQLSRCLGPNTNPCTGELLEYVYDGKDQLRRVTRKVNGAVTGSEEYWYQSEGGRVAIVKRDSAGQKTEMVWFIGDTQAHYDPSGAVTRVLSNISLGTPVARVERTSNTSTSLDFQFHGSASSLLASVSSTGTTSAAFSYTPFGDALESTGSDTADHRRRFNDKYQDELSSLKYYGARYYDSIVLGWTQQDPIFTVAPDAASTTPRRAATYMFSLNNPLRYMDPDGRNPVSHPEDQAQLDRRDRGARIADRSSSWMARRILDHPIFDAKPISFVQQSISNWACLVAPLACLTYKVNKDGYNAAGAAIADITDGDDKLSAQTSLTVLGAITGVGTIKDLAVGAGRGVRAATDLISASDDALVTFYHGTSVSNADDIVSNGIKAVSVNTHNHPTGSFFTVNAAEENALITASHMAARLYQGQRITVVTMTFKEAHYKIMQAAGQIHVGPMPGLNPPPWAMETVFYPKCFPTINQNAVFSRVEAEL